MERESTGLIGDVKGIASTGLRAIRTRLELAVIELTEQRAWAARFLVVAVAGLYLVTFGLMLAVFALALWAPEANRPAIFGGFAAVFVLAGGGGIAYLVKASRRREPLLKETIAVLKGDEQALRNGLGATGD
ncbi:MAG TPA: phage holin family protein [Usitatibacter sp.]|nr:phage holin family protein [Usitatibacter sp.]